jgi:hypothetical protein
MTQYQAELYHHGIKGQRWGVRRYQNADGSYTAAGKARRGSAYGTPKSSDPDARKARAKKIAAAAGALTLAAAAAYVASNPKARKVVANAVKSIGKVTGEKATRLAKKGKDYTQKAAKQAKDGLKEGVKEGFKEGPKKAVKAVVGGAAMYATKKALDKAVGPTEAGRIMKANDKKKIGSFWSFVEQDNKKDDDDD